MIVDLSRQNKLDADPRAIQQIEFVGQLKKWSLYKCWWNTINIYFNDFFKKNEEMSLKFFQGGVTVL